MFKLGATFAATGLSAMFWTSLGLAFSIAAGLFYASNNFGISAYVASAVGGILLLLSGFFDVIDGNVARVSNKTSLKGAFLDSTFDKVAEVVIFLGIAIGRLADPFWCLLGISMSLLVSYSRSRAESLGVSLQGIGIGERAERLIIIAIAGLLPWSGSLQWGIMLVVALASITFVQRVIVTSRKLST